MWQCITLARVISANKPSSQRETKVFDVDLAHTGVCDGHVVATEDECIHHSTVEHKPEDVAVELPGLAPDPVVVSKLVRMVHPTHEFIVDDNILGTWNLVRSAISILPLN